MSGISCVGSQRFKPPRSAALNPPRDIASRKRVSNVGEATASNYRIIPIEFPWGEEQGKRKEKKIGERKGLKRFTNLFPFVFRLFLFLFFFSLASSFPVRFVSNHTLCCIERRARISQREITKLRVHEYIAHFSAFPGPSQCDKIENWVEIK